MRIKIAPLSSLQNMEHFQFAQHIVAICKESKIEKLISVLPPLEAALEIEDKALNQPRMEEATEELRNLDKIRDKAYKALQLLVEICLHSDSPATVASGTELNRVLRTYPGILQANYDKATGLIKNLIADLREAKTIAIVNKVGGSPYVNRLDKANKDFDARYRSRLKSAIPSGTFDIRKLRATTDIALDAVFIRIDALNDLEPTTAGLAELITQYNALVDKKRKLLAKRVGTGKAARQKRMEKYKEILNPLIPALEKEMGLEEKSLSFFEKTKGTGKNRLYFLSTKDEKRQVWIHIVKTKEGMDKLVLVDINLTPKPSIPTADQQE